MSLLLPPHPDIELIRYEAFSTLREFFELQLSRLLNGTQIDYLFFDCLFDYTTLDKRQRSADDELLPKIDNKIIVEKFLQHKIKQLFVWKDEIKSQNDLYEYAKSFRKFVDNICLSADEK
jgi:hypothetical protein